MEAVRTVELQGKEITIVDLSNSATIEQGVAILEKGEQYIKTQPPKSVLLITDITNARYDVTGVEAMKNYSTAITPYIKASAVVGITGVRSVILRAVVRVSGRKIQQCETLEQAMDWLVLQ